jgi:hypothetical protein
VPSWSTVFWCSRGGEYPYPFRGEKRQDIRKGHTLGFDAGDSNLYRYINNNPLANADPSGLQGEYYPIRPGKKGDPIGDLWGYLTSDEQKTVYKRFKTRQLEQTKLANDDPSALRLPRVPPAEDRRTWAEIQEDEFRSFLDRDFEFNQLANGRTAKVRDDIANSFAKDDSVNWQEGLSSLVEKLWDNRKLYVSPVSLKAKLGGLKFSSRISASAEVEVKVQCTSDGYLKLLISAKGQIKCSVPITVVSQWRCTAGRVSHSLSVQTWSANPAAIAGVRCR